MKWTTLMCVLGLLLCSLGCTESSPPTEPERSQHEGRLERASSVDPDFDPERERAAKKNWQERHAAQTQIADIDWDRVEQEVPMEVALEDDQRETLRLAEVPVLLPDNDMLLESATYTARKDWYAAAMEGDGVSVYVSGTRLEFVHPSIDARAIDEDGPSVTQNELIMTLSFKRWGAAYVVEVECARPSEDARCADEGYVREIGRSLGLAGGLR